MRDASASKNICWQKSLSLQLCSHDRAYPQSTSPDVLVILRPEVANLLFGQPLLFGDIDPLFQIFLCSIRNSQESDRWQNAIKNTGERNSFVRTLIWMRGHLLAGDAGYLARVSASSSSSARPGQSLVVADDTLVVLSLSPIWVWSGMVAKLLSRESKSRQKNS